MPSDQSKSELPRSAKLLAQMVENNPTIQESMKKDPVKTSRDLADMVTKQMLPPARVTDKLIYRMVVFALGAVVVIAVSGTIWLAAQKLVPVPETITAIGSAAIGALAGLLAPSPSEK